MAREKVIENNRSKTIVEDRPRIDEGLEEKGTDSEVVITPEDPEELDSEESLAFDEEEIDPFKDKWEE